MGKPTYESICKGKGGRFRQAQRLKWDDKLSPIYACIKPATGYSLVSESVENSLPPGLESDVNSAVRSICTGKGKNRDCISEGAINVESNLVPFDKKRGDRGFSLFKNQSFEPITLKIDSACNLLKPGCYNNEYPWLGGKPSEKHLKNLSKDRCWDKSTTKSIEADCWSNCKASTTEYNKCINK